MTNLNCNCRTSSSGGNIITIIDHQGLQGPAGKDGNTPWINEDNLHWIIGTVDTGIVAKGENGTTPHIGENNHWFIGTQDTGVIALGQDGKTPWINPTNLHWMIGDVDTGVIAGTREEPITDRSVKTYDDITLFPTTGVDNTIYIDKSTNKEYRFNTSTNAYEVLSTQNGDEIVDSLKTFTESNTLIIQG